MTQDCTLLAQSGYRLIGWLSPDYVVLDAGNGPEVWVHRDNHWGEVIEIDDDRFKFKRTATDAEIEEAKPERPEPSGVYLHLFHGRDKLDQDMDDWGFDGPVLGPLPYVHVTYASELKIGDDYEPLAVREDCVEYNGKFYGDWSIFDRQALLQDGFTPTLPKKRGS